MEDFKKEIKMFKKEFEEKREKIKQIKAIKDGMREYRG